MSSEPSPAGGRSFDVQFDPDGTALVDVRLGAAHVTFRVSQEQQAKFWAKMRPAMPYVAASVVVATMFAVVANAAPPTTA